MHGAAMSMGGAWFKSGGVAIRHVVAETKNRMKISKICPKKMN